MTTFIWMTLWSGFVGFVGLLIGFSKGNRHARAAIRLKALLEASAKHRPLTEREQRFLKDEELLK